MERAIRHFPPMLVTLVLTLVATIAPVQAAGPEPGASDRPGADPTHEQRIVGGTPSPPSAWPSMAALLHANEPNNYLAQFCGATVVDPSWVLTAAHCVEQTDASGIDVLTGTQSLISGGFRQSAVEVRSFPFYDPATTDGDYALIRLADPTTAPTQSLIGQGGTVAAGTSATTIGWGNRVSGGNDYPANLYQVGVPILSNAMCSATGYGSDITAQMICAGQAPYTAHDSCDGDSGGPLLVADGADWQQVGITSWGAGCADGLPGVYARVAAQSSWIQDQVRFGPHPFAGDFVDSTWRDLFAVAATKAEMSAGVDAQHTMSPSTWLSELIAKQRYQFHTGGVARLYQAFFLRDPDISGFTFWWHEINTGWSHQRIANFFATSPEFVDRYGSLGNEAFVDLVYQNVLGRSPDATGRAFWVHELDTQRRSRGEVMVGFSESDEFRLAMRTHTDVVITYFGLVRRVPSPAEVAYWSTQSNHRLVAALLASVEYHRRF